MRIDEYAFEVVVTADRGKYLKYVDETLSENKVGKPIRIIFSKPCTIPEFTEESIISSVPDSTKNVDTEVVEKPTKKRTTRKSK